MIPEREWERRSSNGSHILLSTWVLSTCSYRHSRDSSVAGIRISGAVELAMSGKWRFHNSPKNTKVLSKTYPSFSVLRNEVFPRRLEHDLHHWSDVSHQTRANPVTQTGIDWVIVEALTAHGMWPPSNLFLVCCNSMQCASRITHGIAQTNRAKWQLTHTQHKRLGSILCWARSCVDQVCENRNGRLVLRWYWWSERCRWYRQPSPTTCWRMLCENKIFATLAQYR